MINCHYCKKDIEGPVFIKLTPAIILQPYFAQIPPVFKCPEQAEDYAQTINLHDDCWMEVLKYFGIPIHDLNKVAQEILQKQLDGLKQGE